MLELHWHSLEWSVEDAWIVHIVPGIEETVCAFKHGKSLSPELLSVSVEEVHES